MKKYYAGIGSRSTPADIEVVIERVCVELNEPGAKTQERARRDAALIFAPDERRLHRGRRAWPGVERERTT